MLCDFFVRKVRWSYFSKGSMWLVCLIVLNGVGHKNWRVRNSTMYRTVQRNFDLQPFTLKTKRLLRHITRWCTSNKVTMVIRFYVEGNLYSITQIVKRTNILHRDHPFKTSACLRGEGVSPCADGQKVTVHKDQKSPS